MSSSVLGFAIAVTSLLCVSFTLANEPGPAALDFIERLARGGLDGKPGGDTALRATTMQEKQRSIQRRLERLEGDLKGGEFELGRVEKRGDLAAVLVRKVGGFDAREIPSFSGGDGERGRVVEGGTCFGLV